MSRLDLSLDRRNIIAAFVGMGVCASLNGAFAAANPSFDLQYGPGDLRRLDFYPAVSPATATVVYIHGGGFKQGDKSTVRAEAREFIAQGFNFAAIDYRLYPATTVAGMVDDVCGAVRFLRARAKQFGISSSRLVLMGHSAGGYLAALATPRVLPAALVILDGGALDLSAELKSRPSFCPVFDCNAAHWGALSPVERVRYAVHWPPTFIAYGSARADTAEPALALKSALDAKVATAQIAYFKDKAHTAFIRDLADPDDPLTRDVFDFLKHTLQHS